MSRYFYKGFYNEILLRRFTKVAIYDLIEGNWDNWSEWTKESEGVSTRRRTCKTQGKCSGSSLQSRTTKITYIYVIENDECKTFYTAILKTKLILIFLLLDENAEDWEMWGEWVVESETMATRRRVCKNKGLTANCRGKAVQKRVREVKKEKEPQYTFEGKIYTLVLIN